MTIIVHPNNGVETVGKGPAVSTTEQWENLQARYAELVNAGTVLSLIQTIKGTNNPRTHK